MKPLSKFFHLDVLPTSIREESIDTVFIDQSGNIERKDTSRCWVLHQQLTEDIDIEMSIIPAGSYSMGSLHSRGYEDEEPQHFVNINKFLISRTTVTQQQWKAVMGKLPPCRGKGLEFPVDRVSWFDAQRFCERLSKLTGKPYRLPSEAEWEYACRAGSISAFCYGDMITTDYCNYVGSYAYGGGPVGVYRHGPIPSKQFPPNKFGLYDMHGNLWEWCLDNWHENYIGAPSTGEAWIHGGTEERVLRGGSWHDTPDLCRSACRLKLRPTEGEDFVGFRIALSDGPYIDS